MEIAGFAGTAPLTEEPEVNFGGRPQNGWLRLLAVAVLLALFGPACSGVSGDSDSRALRAGGAEAQPEAEPGAAADAEAEPGAEAQTGAVADAEAEPGAVADTETIETFSVAAWLGELPARESGDLFDITIADVEALAEVAGVQVPVEVDDPDQLREYFGPITGRVAEGETPRSYLWLPSMLRGALEDSAMFREEFGFSVADVNTFAAVDLYRDEFVVLTGVTVRSDLPEVVPGVVTVGEGEDRSIDVLNRTVARPLGRPYRIADRGDAVAVSRLTPEAAAWVEGELTPTLADDHELVTAAAWLDESDVMSAYMLRTDVRYSSVALGWGFDESGPLGVVIFSYPSIEAAVSEEDRLRQLFAPETPIADGVLGDVVQLESFERREFQFGAVVRFPEGSNPRHLANLMYAAEGPFAF